MVFARMVGYLAHIHHDLTFELEAYKIYRSASSEVRDFKGKVKELTTQVKRVSKNVLSNLMVIDLEEVKMRAETMVKEVSRRLTQDEAKITRHLVSLRTTPVHQDEMRAQRNLLTTKKMNFLARKAHLESMLKSLHHSEMLFKDYTKSVSFNDATLDVIK